MNALQLAFAAASPAGAGARLSTLIFHRVLPQPDPLFPDEMHAARFDTLCARLRAWFNVLPADQAVQRLKAGTLPSRALAITFDDGYADNHDVALPILQRHGLCATFFVATGYLDGGRMWNDTVVEAVRSTPLQTLDLRAWARAFLPEAEDLTDPVAVGSTNSKRALIDKLLPRIKYLQPALRQQAVDGFAALAASTMPQDLMMSSAQVRFMADAGMQIGAHTVSHPILARLDRQAARDEIAGSRDVLQDLLRLPVPLFAYPNGKPGTDYTAQSAQLVGELGFDAAFTTVWGAARASDTACQLPRFTPWDTSGLPFALRMLGNFRRRVVAL